MATLNSIAARANLHYTRDFSSGSDTHCETCGLPFGDSEDCEDCAFCEVHQVAGECELCEAEAAS